MTGAMVVSLSLLAGIETPVRAGPKSSCIACHEKLGEKDPKLAAPALALQKEDVHAANGFGCQDCHGGNPLAAPDDKKAAHDEAKSGFIGAPDPTAIPELCGRCHGDADFMRTYDPRLRVDQLIEYKTSHHGQKLAQNEDVATCSSCHGNHGVLHVKDPRSPVYPTHVAQTCGRCHADTKKMASHGIPTDQRAKWEKSVHGQAIERGDLAAPTCNGCHGNHGAAPPNVGSVVFVCGQCHAREATLFAASPLKKPWEKLGLKDCIKCHSNHLVLHPTDRMVGIESSAVCTSCHEHGKVGLGVAQAVRGSYEKLKTEIDTAQSLLDRAEQMGMEVSADRFQLSEARNHLIEGRVLVHSFDQKRITGNVEVGVELARKVQQAGELALDQLAVRRRGLAMALAFIVLAILALWLKVRDIEAGGTSDSATG